MAVCAFLLQGHFVGYLCWSADCYVASSCLVCPQLRGHHRLPLLLMVATRGSASTPPSAIRWSFSHKRCISARISLEVFILFFFQFALVATLLDASYSLRPSCSGYGLWLHSWVSAVSLGDVGL